MVCLFLISFARVGHRLSLHSTAILDCPSPVPALTIQTLVLISINLFLTFSSNSRSTSFLSMKILILFSKACSLLDFLVLYGFFGCEMSSTLSLGDLLSSSWVDLGPVVLGGVLVVLTLT